MVVGKQAFLFSEISIFQVLQISFKEGIIILSSFLLAPKWTTPFLSVRLPMLIQPTSPIEFLWLVMTWP